MPLLPKDRSRRPLARSRRTSDAGGWPEPASRIRPEASRTIALMRISRPARAIRATPWLPNRVSSVPFASRRMTAPRGDAGGGQVGAGDERPARRALADRGRADPRRLARAERDGDDAVAAEGRVGHAGRAHTDRRERRGVDAAAATADGEGERAVAAHEQAGDAAADAEHRAVDRAVGAAPERQIRRAVRKQADDDRDLARARAAEDHAAGAVHHHRAQLRARRPGQHVAQAGAEARIDLARGQQPDGDEAGRAVGQDAACRRRRSGRRGTSPARGRPRASCRAARARSARRCRTSSPACRSCAAARPRTGRRRRRRPARGCRRSP